jgi:hypothetical protein
MFIIDPLRFPREIAPLVCDAATFDGTSDYLKRTADLAGAADGKTGILSFWFRKNGGDGARRELFVSGNPGSSNDKVIVEFTATNQLGITLKDAAASTTRWKSLSVATFTAGAAWHHFLAAWDVTVAARCKVYIDGTDATNNTNGPTNATLDYTHTNWGIGAWGDNGADKFNGDLAELYWAPNQWLDISQASVRNLFRTPAGKPTDLGSDGSGPTGSAPLLYLHLGDGEIANNFALNRAGNGNYTIVGALTTAATSPSD